MTTAYVALGSNLPDRLVHLQRAVAALRALEGVEVGAASSVYETDPDGPPQPDYLNAVVRLETTLGPHELLAALKGIERDLGRISRERWGPREIDLDLLLYGDKRIDSDVLTVPHPRMDERAFVLVPLGELTGELRSADGVRRYAGQDALSP